MTPFTVSSRVFLRPAPLALCRHRQSYLPHAGISPRTPNGTVFTSHLHVSFPLSRMAHAHPAIQRDRESARPSLVVPQLSESSQAQPLGLPPGSWALQALPVSRRGAEMVERVGADPGLLCALGRAPWDGQGLRPRMPQPHPAHHVLRPAATAAIPRSLPLGRCGERMRADAVRLSKVAQNGIPQQGALCYPTPGEPGLKSRG